MVYAKVKSKWTLLRLDVGWCRSATGIKRRLCPRSNGCWIHEAQPLDPQRFQRWNGWNLPPWWRPWCGANGTGKTLINHSYITIVNWSLLPFFLNPTHVWWVMTHLAIVSYFPSTQQLSWGTKHTLLRALRTVASSCQPSYSPSC